MYILIQETTQWWEIITYSDLWSEPWRPVMVILKSSQIFAAEGTDSGRNQLRRFDYYLLESRGSWGCYRPSWVLSKLSHWREHIVQPLSLWGQSCLVTWTGEEIPKEPGSLFTVLLPSSAHFWTLCLLLTQVTCVFIIEYDRVELSGQKYLSKQTEIPKMTYWLDCLLWVGHLFVWALSYRTPSDHQKAYQD